MKAPYRLSRGGKLALGAKNTPAIAIPHHPVETTQVEFASLGLGAPLLESLRRIGFEQATPIQAEVIPAALSGRDLISLAATGAGKTIAFCIPLVEQVTCGQGIVALILSPTRETALQTQAFLDLLGEACKVRSACLVGGVKMGPQVRALAQNPDIVVATPGRLIDHMERGTARVERIRFVVLDEADHMLDMGFLPQVQRIFSALPTARQTLMFSATLPLPIQRLAQQVMISPVHIDNRPEESPAAGVPRPRFANPSEPGAAGAPSSSKIPALYLQIRDLVARSASEPALRGEIDLKMQRLRTLQEAEADALERRFEEQLRLRSGTGRAHLQRIKERLDSA